LCVAPEGAGQVSVGSVLAEARIRAGLTLDEVSERTRIRRTLVDEIEHDDFHSCGGDFYARGHVKSIARLLQIDPAPLTAEFDAAHLPDDDLHVADGVLDHAHTHDDLGARLRPNWTAVMALALVVLVVFGAVRLASGIRSGGTGGGGGAVAAQDVPVPAVPNVPGDAPTTTGGGGVQPEVAAPAGVTVKVRAVGGPSWVSATARNGRVLYQQLLAAGEQRTVRNDRLVKLLIGNAGAVDLRVNGRELGSPGAQGEVVRLSFGPAATSVAGS
jgi:cytoskeleton protein RodZ